MGGHSLKPASADAVAAAKVTVDEFKRRMAATKPEDVFLALDRNGDGFVERAEFIAGRQAFTLAFTKLQAEYVFRGLDLDRDQRVCRVEFHAVLRQGRFFQTSKEPQPSGVAVPSSAPAVPAAAADG